MWISVNDKLPEKDDKIFVSFKYEDKRYYTYLKGYLLLDDIDSSENNYDYWMPIPKIDE